MPAEANVEHIHNACDPKLTVAILRSTVASLLLGLAASLALLTQFFSPLDSHNPSVNAVQLIQDNLGEGTSNGEFVDGVLHLSLTKGGFGQVRFLTDAIDPQDYPYLRLSVEDPPPDLVTAVSLRRAGKTTHRYILEDQPLENLWLAMEEFEGWEGPVEAINLQLFSEATDTLKLPDISLHPAATSLQLLAILSDLGTSAPWKRAQMNTHTGVAKVASFYPVPMAVTLMLLSVAAYGLIVSLSRGRLAFSWSVPAMIFLTCWLILDLVWQNRLLRQVAHSHFTFAGLSTPEKLAAGPDASLYATITAAKAHIDDPNARVMVATTDLYRGMRAAYFLYPLNAYWRLEGPEIPDKQYLRKGDYILRLSPSRAYAHKDRGVRLPETRMYPAETVYSSVGARLVRLK